MKLLVLSWLIGVCVTSNVMAIRFNTHASTASSAAKDTISLNGQWFLQPVLEADTATGRFPSIDLNLAKGSFTGNTGCNTMRGSFRQKDSSVVFGTAIATTKMMCPGYDEAAFLNSLQRVNRYRFEAGALILMENTVELSRWTRRPDRKLKINHAE